MVLSFTFFYASFFILLSSVWTNRFSTNESFKTTWNEYYVSSNQEWLKSLYSKAWENVTKNKVGSCQKDWFYNTEWSNNEYFCKDWTVFIFSNRPYIESVIATLKYRWLDIMMLSLMLTTISSLSILNLYGFVFKTLSNKSLTVWEIDKKFNESVDLFKKYVSDIENFDNNPKWNVLALFKYAYAYSEVSNRHNNNIMNKLTSILWEIEDRWLSKVFHNFESEYSKFVEKVWLKGTFSYLSFPISKLFSWESLYITFILWIIIILSWVLVNYDAVDISTWNFQILNYISLGEWMKSIFSTDYYKYPLWFIIFTKIELTMILMSIIKLSLRKND